MFYTLHECYKQVELYKNNLFNKHIDVANIVMEIVLDKDFCTIITQYFTEFKKSDGYNLFYEYISRCCNLCWKMIYLWNKQLTITPSKWKEEDGTMYNDKLHKRVLGSDRKCKKILYYVWPVIAQNNVTIQDQKIDVVVKNEFHQKNKNRHNPFSSIIHV